MKKSNNGKKVYELSTGYKFTATPVNSMLVYDAQEQFPYPEPPKVQIKQGGSTVWMDNPSDSTYQERFSQVERQRNMAALSCVIQNGIRLEGEVPADREWLRRVRRQVNLALYENESGEITGEDLEYLFLRYVAIASADDYSLVFNSATLTEEAVQEAADSFSGDETGD